MILIKLKFKLTNHGIMNTIIVNRKSGQHIYQLKENGTTVLKLNYNPEQHIARIEAGNEGRVLFLENEGFIRTRISIKNEYGVGIGSLVFNGFSGNHGEVEIEEIRYMFLFQHNANPELEIYKNSHSNLIFTCRLPLEKDNLSGKYSQSYPLIIAVTWYLFQKSTHRNKLVSFA